MLVTIVVMVDLSAACGTAGISIVFQILRKDFEINDTVFPWSG